MSDPNYAAQVAAEVAARYGVTVVPDVLRVVPAGVSAHPELRWFGKALRYIDSDGNQIDRKVLRQKSRAAVSRSIKRNVAVDPVVAMRRAEVARLNAAGLTDGQIAAEMALQIHTVAADRQKLRLAVNAPRSISGQLAEDAQQIAGRVRALHGRGFSVAQIARHMGITAASMRGYMVTVLGIGAVSAQTPKARIAKNTVRAIAAPKTSGAEPHKIRAQIAEAAQSGLTVAQIGALVGLQRGAIYKHLKALAIDAARARDVARDDFHSKVRDLVGQGKTALQSAAALSVHRSKFYKAMRAMGLAIDGQSCARAARIADAQARRNRIAALVAAGKTVVQICALLPEVTQFTIYRDLRILQLGTVAQKNQGAPIVARAANAVLLASAGKTVQQIAAALDTSVHTVRADLRRSGVVVTRSGAAVDRCAKAMELRCSTYANMVARGLTRAEMAAELGVSPRGVSHWIGRFGLSVPAAVNTASARNVLNARRRVEIDQRRAQVLALRAAGVRLYDMPARLGCSLSTVVEDLAVLRRAAGDVWVRGAAKGPHRNVLADPAALTQMRAAAAQGRSVSWIARMLGVSQKAVTKHLQAEVMADAA